MTLIPAEDAAGGPERVSLSRIFPVIKQTVAQDSVHAEYKGGRLVNTESVLIIFQHGHLDE